MILSFNVEVRSGTKLINAVVTPFPANDVILFDVHTEQKVFTIKPMNTKANAVLWVNLRNEPSEIYQEIGREIQKKYKNISNI